MKTQARIFDMDGTVCLIDSILWHAAARADFARQQQRQRTSGPHVTISVRDYDKLINTHFLGSLHVA